MKARGISSLALVCLLIAGLAPHASSDVPPKFLLKFGSYGSAPGQFAYISGIEVDRFGYVYAIDANSGRIEKFTGDGEFVSEWGSSGLGDGQFSSPTGLALNSAGEVHVSDYSANRIQKFTNDGRLILGWGGKGNGTGEFDGPQAIAVDDRGDIYVLDRGNRRVQKFTPDGRFILEWGSAGLEAGQFLQPVGLATDHRGRIYVTDYEVGGVQVFDNNGKFISRWGSGQEGASEFLNGYGASVDSTGGVYVVDGRGYRVRKYGSDGKLEFVLGSEGSHRPFGTGIADLAIDSTGSIYVSEGTSIQKFGSGPTPAERVLESYFQRMDAVTAFVDPILATPLGEGWNSWRRERSGSCSESDVNTQLNAPEERRLSPVARCRVRFAEQSFEYSAYVLGFATVPTLERVTWRLDRGVDLTSKGLDSIRVAIADVLKRRLGDPECRVIRNPAVDIEAWMCDTTVFSVRGSSVRLYQAITNDQGDPTALFIERSTVGLLAAESSANICDLRALEGWPYAGEAHYCELLSALEPNWPDLARALEAPYEDQREIVDERDSIPHETAVPAIASGRTDTATAYAIFMRPSNTRFRYLSDVREALAAIQGPETSREQRNLVNFAVDQWLRSLRWLSDEKSPPERQQLAMELADFGVRFAHHPEANEWIYCGSLLQTLAEDPGTDRWAASAFVTLLEGGSFAPCDPGDDGGWFRDGIFPAVIRHGEEFLSRYPDLQLWPTVALRVALARETAWSLATTTPDQFPELSKDSEANRARAIELFRRLESLAQGPRFKQGIGVHLRILELQLDSGCRTYLVDPEGC